ncbi:hypothetical protein ABT384_33580 [Streptomyces lanatus]|uniref:Secreted protein n=1 Tax=Streptomyces lanatus TaxID=66900 RepID=A0ABV1Y135_9ACTN|nr:hypothetical protein [Streptomyces lanatus]GHH24305.1 hypothetical protein GCM10018780_74450 [Streptomyces lanatus]
MIVLILVGILVLAVGGCVCVVWASRGGPRWVRVVASVTLGVGEVVRVLSRSSGRRSGAGSSSSDGD